MGGKRIYLTKDGRTQCLSDWAREFGMKPITLHKRHDAGMTEDQILNPEFIPAAKPVEYGGVKLTRAQWANKLGMKVGGVSRRISLGQPLTPGRRPTGRTGTVDEYGVFLEYKGERHNLTGWAKKIGVTKERIRQRLKRWGDDLGRVLSPRVSTEEAARRLAEWRRVHPCPPRLPKHGFCPGCGHRLICGAKATAKKTGKRWKYLYCKNCGYRVKRELEAA